ncbi:MAG: FAD-dependent oxidoreductase, partial [Verrucomicrobiales bacterium]|nr:FAD-dependent oxidoreductase [Verrucomicrobiales bacterium]
EVQCARVEWSEPDPITGRRLMKEIAGSDFTIRTDLVLLAMGFISPVKQGLLEDLGVELDKFGNVKVEDFQTSQENIYAAGDMVTGQSLVVNAIYSGRQMAKALDKKIKGFTYLK